MYDPRMPDRGDLPHVDLFTDGACSGNPGPGGWCFILRGAGGREVEQTGGEARTTNNRMELLAVISGLERLTRPSRVDLWSDSRYIVDGLSEWLDQWRSRGWKRSGKEPVKNLELWQRLDELRRVHAITPRWVRGHDDHPENDRCDRLAVEASKRYARDGAAADLGCEG
jgi:ribonuclease HI